MLLAPDDPNPRSEIRIPDGLADVHEGCKKVVEQLARCMPELVVLLTPHGIPVNVMGKSGKPDPAAPPADPPSVTDPATDPRAPTPHRESIDISIRIDSELGEDLIRHFSTSGIPCVRVTGAEAPLSSSETVPLWFLRTLSSTLRTPPKYIIVSLPTPFGGTSLVRSQSAKERIDQNLLLGDQLARFLYWQPHRSVIVSSSNLAHSHPTLPDIHPYFLPDPKWSLPISDSAAVFDAIVEKWATSLNGNILVVDAGNLVSRAISCGFDGCVVLHGVMKYEGLEKFFPTVWTRHRPSYVGMMGVTFVNERKVTEMQEGPKGAVGQITNFISRMSMGGRPSSFDIQRPL
ncbi:hypothetical protein HDV00_000983 [Rhizophlyctis rosea]|nr:hypothetical protein HDV00_000983 [Rhizophlyctis rosea]